MFPLNQKDLEPKVYLMVVPTIIFMKLTCKPEVMSEIFYIQKKLNSQLAKFFPSYLKCSSTCLNRTEDDLFQNNRLNFLDFKIFRFILNVQSLWKWKQKYLGPGAIMWS